MKSPLNHPYSVAPYLLATVTLLSQQAHGIPGPPVATGFKAQSSVRSPAPTPNPKISTFALQHELAKRQEAPYIITDAAGYSDMLGCARGCVLNAGNNNYAGCGDYSCICSHFYTTALLQMEACVTNACPGDASDLVTASSIFSGYCSPGTAILAASTTPITKPYEITSAAGYSAMPTCAQYCVLNIDGDAYVDCANYACLCKNYATASQLLSACITNGCTGDTSDIATASSIFSAYCAPAEAILKTTPTGSSPTTSGGSNNALSSKGSSKLSPGGIAGIVIGGVIFVVIVVAIFFWRQIVKCFTGQRNKEETRDRHTVAT